MVTERNNPVE